MLFAGAASPALAAAEPKARLVECAAQSCLLVSGYRADASAPVSINGYAVSVEGARNWRARVPVDTLRSWSAPYARTITVASGDDQAEADLPIGLMGHVANLAMLVVRVK